MTILMFFLLLTSYVQISVAYWNIEVEWPKAFATHDYNVPFDVDNKPHVSIGAYKSRARDENIVLRLGRINFAGENNVTMYVDRFAENMVFFIEVPHLGWYTKSFVYYTVKEIPHEQYFAVTTEKHWTCENTNNNPIHAANDPYYLATSIGFLALREGFMLVGKTKIRNGYKIKIALAYREYNIERPDAAETLFDKFLKVPTRIAQSLDTLNMKNESPVDNNNQLNQDMKNSRLKEGAGINSDIHITGEPTKKSQNPVFRDIYPFKKSSNPPVVMIQTISRNSNDNTWPVALLFEVTKTYFTVHVQGYDSSLDRNNTDLEYDVGWIAMANTTYILSGGAMEANQNGGEAMTVQKPYERAANQTSRTQAWIDDEYMANDPFISDADDLPIFWTSHYFDVAFDFNACGDLPAFVNLDSVNTDIGPHVIYSVQKRRKAVSLQFDLAKCQNNVAVTNTTQAEFDINYLSLASVSCLDLKVTDVLRVAEDTHVDNQKEMNHTLILVISCGVVALLVLFIFLFCFWTKRRKRSDPNEAKANKLQESEIQKDAVMHKSVKTIQQTQWVKR